MKKMIITLLTLNVFFNAYASAPNIIFTVENMSVNQKMENFLMETMNRECAVKADKYITFYFTQIYAYQVDQGQPYDYVATVKVFDLSLEKIVDEFKVEFHENYRNYGRYSLFDISSSRLNLCK